MTTPGSPSAGPPGLPPDDLRALVREALRDVLPELLGAAAGAAPRISPRVEEVTVRSDGDLAAFAARVLAAPDDVRSGRLVFRLADGAAPAVSAPPATSSASSASSASSGAVPGDHHVERGAVTERHVRAAERAGGRLVLGPRAVLTPLARDRARTAGVEVVRLRPSDGTDRTDPAAPGRSS